MRYSEWRAPVSVAGIDEAGRGPIAGPVIAAVVIPTPECLEGVRDSKRLTAPRRRLLAQRIKERARGWAIGRAEVWEIDEINILEATLLAMTRAATSLGQAVDRYLIDGNRVPDTLAGAEAIVGGDAREPVIAAASILAKVARDEEMLLWHQRLPEYHFDRHMGYPTRAHLDALERFGPSELHRRSFGPVRRLCEADAR